MGERGRSRRGPPKQWTERHREALAAGAATLGLPLGPAHLDQFERYYRELVAWNQRVNLTAITDPDEVVEKHFLDSLTCVLAFLLSDEGIARPAIEAETSTAVGDVVHISPLSLSPCTEAGLAPFTGNGLPCDVVPSPSPRAETGLEGEVLQRRPALIDIGTGAGFPGVPLKLALPGLRLTLVEAIGKKAQFLAYLVEVLGLKDTVLLVGRAETLGHDPQYRERFDLAVSRAVADLAELAEYCLAFVRVGGRFIAPKKTGIEAEVEAAAAAIDVLGGRPLPPVLLLDPTRQLVVVEKASSTPCAYPRRPGVPAKRPLRAR